MPKVVIFADDLTGANDTAAAIHQQGMAAYTVIQTTDKFDSANDYPCISVNLNSRAMLPGKAAQTLRRAANIYIQPDTMLISKRIDSTLRGNLGSECDALLEQLAPDTVAMVVPAFPKAGRVFRRGEVFVNNIKLEHSAAAQDPVWPMTTSSPSHIFGRQTNKSQLTIPLKIVRQNTLFVAEYISSAIREKYVYLLFEAETDFDIQNIAQAVISLDIPFVAVDPGPFTAALSQLLFPQKNGAGILGVVGSINAVTRRQIQQLLSHSSVSWAVLDVMQILKNPKACAMEVDRVVAALTENVSPNNIHILLLSSVINQAHLPSAETILRYGYTQEEISSLLMNALSEAALRILNHRVDIGGLFTCGGDVTLSVCNALGAHGMIVQSEVIPMAVCGELTREGAKPYWIVTKGGMVGETDAVIRCLNHLLDRLHSTERL